MIPRHIEAEFLKLLMDARNALDISQVYEAQHDMNAACDEIAAACALIKRANILATNFPELAAKFNIHVSQSEIPAPRAERTTPTLKIVH